jgi:hypothetical protein
MFNEKLAAKKERQKEERRKKTKKELAWPRFDRGTSGL